MITNYIQNLTKRNGSLLILLYLLSFSRCTSYRTGNCELDIDKSTTDSWFVDAKKRFKINRLANWVDFYGIDYSDQYIFIDTLEINSKISISFDEMITESFEEEFRNQFVDFENKFNASDSCTIQIDSLNLKKFKLKYYDPEIMNDVIEIILLGYSTNHNELMTLVISVDKEEKNSKNKLQKLLCLVENIEFLNKKKYWGVR